MSGGVARHAAIVATLVAPLLVYCLWPSDAPPAPAAHDAPTAQPVRVVPPTGIPAEMERIVDDRKPPDYSGTLDVRVVAAADGTAVSGASVHVVDGGDADRGGGAADDAGRRAETGDEGRAAFARLALGHARIRADADGFAPSFLTVIVGPGVVEKATVRLDAAVVVEGSVLDAKSGAPIPNAKIDVQIDQDSNHDHPPIAPVTAGADGRYRLGPVPTDSTIRIRATAPGHGHATVVMATPAPAGRIRHVDIGMGRAGVVRGIVRGPDGAVVAGARVRISPSEDPRYAGTVTAADGSYRLAEVPYGTTMTVTAGASGWTDSEPVDDIELGDARPEASIGLKLRPPTSLLVRVLGPSGEVRHASATVGGSRSWAEPGIDGAIAFENVAPGEVVVRARADGCAEATRTVTVRPAIRNETEMRLEASITIAGFVRDAAGKPVQHVAIWRGRDSVFSDRDGTFRVDVDRIGPCRLRVAGAVLIAAPGADSVDAGGCTVTAPADDVVLVVASRTTVHLRVVPPAGMPHRAPESVTQCAVGTASNVGDAASETPVRFVFSDATGILLGTVSPGASGLRIVVGGYAPVVVPVSANAGDRIDLGDVRLSSGRTLTGRVVDAGGHPVAGARVSTVTTTTTADADGVFTLGGFADGPAVVRATAGSAAGATFVDAVERAGSVSITLHPMSTLHVVVVDSAGSPANGADVDLRDGAVAGTADPGRLTTSTADGSGTLDLRVFAGRCRVRAGGAWSEVTVPEGGEAAVRVVAK